MHSSWKQEMTKKPKSGTLSTKRHSDKKNKVDKESDVLGKMKELLGKNKIRFLPHANKRMSERNIIDYEVRQSLSNGKHDASRDRYNEDHQSWSYSIEGKTTDGRVLRIGIGFEIVKETHERLLVITVTDPAK